MSNSMDSAQRIYDNQTPEDNYPPEPDEGDVWEWASEVGGVCHDQFMEQNPIGCSMDFVSWIETHWDDVVKWYIEEQND